MWGGGTRACESLAADTGAGARQETARVRANLSRADCTRPALPDGARPAQIAEQHTPPTCAGTPADAMGCALWCAGKLGWSVFPTKPGEKRPATARGFKDASNDPAEVRRMFDGAGAGCGVAVADGAASGGLVVLDLDRHGADGVEGLRAHMEACGLSLPVTAVSLTGGGGVHVFFRAAGEPPRRAVSVLPGVDLLGEGGYSVLPPTVLAGGGRYQWQEGCAPWECGIAELPAWVADLARKGPDARPGGRFSMLGSIAEGGRNDALLRYGRSLRAKGADDAGVLSALVAANAERCAPPLARAEVERIAANVCKKPCGGAAPGCIDELCEAMRVMPEFAGVRYDTFLNRVSVTGAPWNPEPHVWQEHPDLDHLHRLMQSQCGRAAQKRADVESAFHILADERSSDALRDAFDALPAWDGTPRAATLPCEFLGAAPTRYTRAVWHAFMCGCVARAYEPGCKFDLIPVLVGGQGIGKSTFARMLPLAPEWFTDCLPDLSDGKESALAIEGKQIAELAELTGLRGKDVNAVKSFTTRLTDEYRPPYGRGSVSRPRRCAFLGTANKGAFLNDPTGNRRFLPIECGAIDAEGDLFAPDARGHFSQAWAEALAKYRDRELGSAQDGTAFSVTLPAWCAAEARDAQAAWECEDPFGGELLAFLERVPIGARVCSKQLAEEALGLEHPGTRELNHVQELMDNSATAYGWARLQTKQRCRGILDASRDYGPQRCWEKCPDVADACTRQQRGNSAATDNMPGRAV